LAIANPPLSGFALAILEEQKAVHFSQRRKSQIFRPLEELLVDEYCE